MAYFKNCKHQGFSYAKSGHKDIRIICDLDGECHNKEDCRKCEFYQPRTVKGCYTKWIDRIGEVS